MSLRIALAQFTVKGDPGYDRGRAFDYVQKAAEGGAKVVSFAELAHLSFFPQSPDGPIPKDLAETIPGPTTEALAELAKEFGIVIVYNLYEKDGDDFFDSSPVIDADGTLLGVTRMMHITDFEGFHERRYYEPGRDDRLVYDTAAGRLGVAICYDRHFPEYMRMLAVEGAEVVFVPQAGVADEWPDGMYEAEMRVAAFQNGYFVALTNRVGRDGVHDFGGESFVSDPEGRLIARAARRDHLLFADIDLSDVKTSTARRLFLGDRRPDRYEALSRVATSTRKV